MDYKTVMVGLALDRPNDACLRVAGDLSERFGARVVGVAASDLRPPMYFAEGDFGQKLLDEETAAVQTRLSDLEAEFRAVIGEARRVGGVAFGTGAAGPVHAAAGEGRRYHRGWRTIGNHGRSLRGSGSERSGDAGRQAAHRGAGSRAVAGSEERSGGLEGRARSAPGRVRRAADPGGRKGSHDRGNSRAGHRSRRCNVAGCRRGSLAAQPRHHSSHERSRDAHGRQRTTRQDCYQRRRRRGGCRRLWTLALPRMGAQWCNAPS